MTTLLELKEKLVRFYGKYEVYITPIVKFIVAFAAETENLLENARAKLRRKGASLIVANDVTHEGAGFETDTNVTALVTERGVTQLPLMTKRALADRILDEYVSGADS